MKIVFAISSLAVSAMMPPAAPPTAATKAAQPAVTSPGAARNTQLSALVQGCASLIGTAKPSGFYWVTFSPDTQVLMYCNNDYVFNGVKGGWTLVWSNLRGGKGKLTSDMAWGASIATLPRYRGSSIAQPGADLQSFEVYTGLKWWKRLMGRNELMYEWAHDYGDQRQIDQRAACPFDLNPLARWTITFNQAQCVADTGSRLPGLFQAHSGLQWTTIDSDNDTYNANCAAQYSGTPWWYSACWNGSISGGGENSGSGHFNGAFWTGADTKWGQVDGSGAGNGWIYIR